MSHNPRIPIHSLGLLICALTPVSLVGQLSLSIPAASAQEVEIQTQLDMLPPGDIVGDGQTPVNLHFVALDSTGQATTGITARVTSSDGTAGRLIDNGSGLYQLVWTPPKVDSIARSELTMKVKIPGGSSQEQSWNLKLMPPLGERMT